MKPTGAGKPSRPPLKLEWTRRDVVGARVEAVMRRAEWLAVARAQAAEAHAQPSPQHLPRPSPIATPTATASLRMLPSAWPRFALPHAGDTDEEARGCRARNLTLRTSTSNLPVGRLCLKVQQDDPHKSDATLRTKDLRTPSYLAAISCARSRIRESLAFISPASCTTTTTPTTTTPSPYPLISTQRCCSRQPSFPPASSGLQS